MNEEERYAINECEHLFLLGGDSGSVAMAGLLDLSWSVRHSEEFTKRDSDERQWRLEHPEESATEPSWRSQDRKESTVIIGGIVGRVLTISLAIFAWYCLIYAAQAVEFVRSLPPCK